MKLYTVMLLVSLLVLEPNYLLADTCNVAPGPDMGETPLTDFTVGQLYRGLFPGFLYDYSNTAPIDHDMDGLTLASMIQPLDINGNPSPNGRIVFLSIGFSNNTIEFCGGMNFYDTDGSMDDPAATDCVPPAPLTVCTGSNCPFNFEGGQQSFMEQAFAPNSGADQSGKIVLVDGAKGGQTLPDWDPFSPDNRNCPSDCRADYERIDRILASNPNEHFSKLQVQSIWIKDSDSLKYQPRPALCPPYPQACPSPNPGNDAFAAEGYMGDILRAIRQQYPNLKQVFMSPRIYGGYANTAGQTLNPEPYAFEIGLSIKWLIGSQITEQRGHGGDGRAGNLTYSVPPLRTDAAPWVAWGPYLWANGPNARNDGFPGWFARDLRGTSQADGNIVTNECTHPSINGERKVGKLLLDFMLSSSYTGWFI